MTELPNGYSGHNFTVYRSSAGSGKTFTLVREYLAICLAVPRDFRSILAITFTNKAASEMKERVLLALRQIAAVTDASPDPPPGSMLGQLMGITGLTKGAIAAQASTVLNLILHDYSDFAIGTIDGFANRVIRSFSHDFGLPVQFNISLETDELLSSAVDLLLERAGNDPELTRFLVSYLEANMDDEKGYDIHRILVKFARVLLEEEGQENLGLLQSITPDDFMKVIRQLRERMAQFEKVMRGIGKEALSLIEQSGLEIAHFYYGSTGIGQYFKYLSDGRTDKFEPGSRVKDTVEQNKWYAGGVDGGTKGRIDAVSSQLLDYYQKAQLHVAEGLKDYNLYKLLASTIYPMAVLNEIGRMMAAFKKQQNVVHISEFNARIADVVLREPVPFIYERLGERYHHLMIDEFQDTSRMQWQNFVPLIENALSAGYFNLVVGDGKQAIYRFRNGDVAQFVNLPKLDGAGTNPLVDDRQKVLEDHYRTVPLDVNFRSRPEIIDFNNRLFRFLTGYLKSPEKEVYDGLEQKPDGKKSGGYVDISFLPREGESQEEFNLNETLRAISESLEDGYRPSEIAILCRSNRQSSLLAGRLIERGIPVISSESLLLSQSPGVNLLVATLRLLFSGDDMIEQSAIAGYLYRNGQLPGLTWEEIFNTIASASGENRGLFRLLKSHGMELRREELLALPLYDLCETLIRIFGLNSRSDAYLQRFLGAVVTFGTADMHSQHDFLKWWDEAGYKVSVVVPEGIDAIRTLTIHKAKGLQFPVVIFPYADAMVKNTRNYLWFDTTALGIDHLPCALLKVQKALAQTRFAGQFEQEEQRSVLDLMNVLYVVNTRAEDRLYIFTSAPPKKTDIPKSLPAYFAAFLEAEGRWDESTLSYRYGERSTSGRNTEPGPPPLVPGPMVSENWRNRLAIRRRAPLHWGQKGEDAAIRFGNVVHGVLSGISGTEDIGPAISGKVASGELSAAEASGISELVRQTVSHPQLRRYFTGGMQVLAEPEILLPDGTTFRPDRVVFDEGVPVVIEFKTGVKDELHLVQLSHYGALLRQMGYPEVKELLVYLHDGIEVIDAGGTQSGKPEKR